MMEQFAAVPTALLLERTPLQSVTYSKTGVAQTSSHAEAHPLTHDHLLEERALWQPMISVALEAIRFHRLFLLHTRVTRACCSRGRDFLHFRLA